MAGIQPTAPGDERPNAPQTPTERVVLQIWSQVLKSDGIGIHDDFFDLGGDSHAAMRCINRISVACGVELPLDVFFLEPSDIAVVASHVDRMRREADAGATTSTGEGQP